MKDDRSRAFAVLVAVFLIGIIIGSAGIYLWQKPSKAVPALPEARIPLPPNGSPPLSMSRPKVPEFNMTPEQQEQFGRILKETGEKMQALMNEQHEWEAKWYEKRKEIWIENDRKVREILNEEQKAKFDPWLEQLRKWRDRPPRRKSMESPKEKRKPEPQPERL